MSTTFVCQLSCQSWQRWSCSKTRWFTQNLPFSPYTPTPYTPHPTPCTPHPTPCTLHPCTPFQCSALSRGGQSGVGKERRGGEGEGKACGLGTVWCGAVWVRVIQGCLAHRKAPPPRTLPKASLYLGPYVVPGGRGVLMSEISLCKERDTPLCLGPLVHEMVVFMKGS